MRGRDELAAALELAFAHDEKVLVEEGVEGAELECGVLGNARALASASPRSCRARDWYDYSAKYDEGGSDIVIPAPLSERRRRAGARDGLARVPCLRCEGMARIDFFLRPDGRALVNEVNTIPGFTRTSVYARLLEARACRTASCCDRLIELALERLRAARALPLLALPRSEELGLETDVRPAAGGPVSFVIQSEEVARRVGCWSGTTLVVASPS